MFSESHWEDIYTDWWKVLLVIVGALALVALVIVIISSVKRKKGMSLPRSTKDLTYGAICLSASFALSFISIFTMPNGGTITPASALPLLIYCYYFGFRKGSIVCSAYMILQLIQKPYIVSPWSALFDYLVPFLAMSLVGIFHYSPTLYNKTLAAGKPPIKSHYRFFIGVIFYFLIRYVSHVTAGVLFWSGDINFLFWNGDLAGTVALGYSLTYNLLYLLPDTIIAAGAGLALLCSKTFNGFMATNSYTFKNTDTTAKNNQRA